MYVKDSWGLFEVSARWSWIKLCGAQLLDQYCVCRGMSDLTGSLQEKSNEQQKIGECKHLLISAETKDVDLSGVCVKIWDERKRVYILLCLCTWWRQQIETLTAWNEKEILSKLQLNGASKSCTHCNSLLCVWKYPFCGPFSLDGHLDFV